MIRRTPLFNTAQAASDGGGGGLPPVDPEVAALRKELDKKGKDIDQLKRLVLAQPQPVQVQQQPQQQQQPYDMEQLKKEFYKEPVRMTTDIATAVAQRAVQEMGANVAAASYPTLRESAKQLVRQRNPQLFDRFDGEIEQQVGSLHAQYQTNATVWQSAMELVRGRHTDELIEEARKAPVGNGLSAAIHVSDKGGPTNSRAATPVASTEKCTQEEHDVARKLGLTDAQYLKGKKDYANQEKKHSRGPSSWDPYITVSTKERRLREQEAKRGKTAA